MRPSAASVCGLTLLVHEEGGVLLAYSLQLLLECVRPYATSVCGRALLVYEALRY